MQMETRVPLGHYAFSFFLPHFLFFYKLINIDSAPFESSGFIRSGAVHTALVYYHSVLAHYTAALNQVDIQHYAI